MSGKNETEKLAALGRVWGTLASLEVSSADSKQHPERQEFPLEYVADATPIALKYIEAGPERDSACWTAVRANKRAALILVTSTGGDNKSAVWLILDAGASKKKTTGICFKTNMANAEMDVLLRFYSVFCRADLKCVCRLFGSGVSAGIKAEDGMAPLHIAAIQDRHEVMMDLMLLGANKNVQGPRHGYTPLHVACRSGRYIATAALLRAHADVNIAAASGEAAIHLAARENYPQIVRALLQHGATPGDRCERGYTPLHIAARNGHSETVECLVKAGADVLAKATQHEETPLHGAAAAGHASVINQLLAAGAATEQEGFLGMTALHIAVGELSHGLEILFFPVHTLWRPLLILKINIDITTRTPYLDRFASV